MTHTIRVNIDTQRVPGVALVELQFIQDGEINNGCKNHGYKIPVACPPGTIIQIEPAFNDCAASATTKEF